MALAYNPPVEHLVIFGPEPTARGLILGLSSVMRARGRLPAFHIAGDRAELPSLLGRYGRLGVLLAHGEAEDRLCWDWLREHWPGVKRMILCPDPRTVSPFSYREVRFPAPQGEADYGLIADWFGITPYGNEMEDPR